MDCCEPVTGYYPGMTCGVCQKPFRNQMKTLKKVEIIAKYVDTIPEKNELEQGIIYVSLHYKTSTHLCLCGCGELTVTPLNETYGWKLSINQTTGKISLSPSIGNYQFQCQSHYIISNSVANFV